MRVLFLLQKPYEARKVFGLAEKIWPNAEFSAICVSPLGVYWPALPRGLSWSDYPHIAPFVQEDFAPPAPNCLFIGLRWNPAVQNFTREWSVDPVQARLWLKNADRVLSGSGNEFHIDTVCRKIVSKPLASVAEQFLIVSFDESHVLNALQKPTAVGHPDILKAVDQGRARNYFHYQFAVNSTVILRRTAQGLTHASAAPVSKYQLQILQAMGRLPLASEGGWMVRMQDWSGSGRYIDTSEGMGSIKSRVPILSGLSDLGWVQRAKGKGPAPLFLTEDGRAFLQRLHPDCWDPDLPFRLAHWTEQGFAQSKPAMDRYIRTFFGKQKRFLDRLGRL